MVRLTTARLASGFQGQLAHLLAALLNTSRWRIDVPPTAEWMIYASEPTAKVHLLSPDSPGDLTALALRALLEQKLLELRANGTADTLTRAQQRAARFVDVASGSFNCTLDASRRERLPPPAVPPPAVPPPAPPPPSPHPSPSSPSQEENLANVSVTLYDDFGDGWGEALLAVRLFSGSRRLSSSLALWKTLRLPMGLGVKRLAVQVQRDASYAFSVEGGTETDLQEVSWRLHGGSGSEPLLHSDDVARLHVAGNGMITTLAPPNGPPLPLLPPPTAATPPVPPPSPRHPSASSVEDQEVLSPSTPPMQPPPLPPSPGIPPPPAVPPTKPPPLGPPPQAPPLLPSPYWPPAPMLPPPPMPSPPPSTPRPRLPAPTPPVAMPSSPLANPEAPSLVSPPPPCAPPTPPLTLRSPFPPSSPRALNEPVESSGLSTVLASRGLDRSAGSCEDMETYAKLVIASIFLFGVVGIALRVAFAVCGRPAARWWKRRRRQKVGHSGSRETSRAREHTRSVRGRTRRNHHQAVVGSEMLIRVEEAEEARDRAVAKLQERDATLEDTRAENDRLTMETDELRERLLESQRMLAARIAGMGAQALQQAHGAAPGRAEAKVNKVVAGLKDQGSASSAIPAVQDSAPALPPPSCKASRKAPRNDSAQSRSSLADAYKFKFPLETRVAHDSRGVGTVTELMADGRTRVSFDSGEEHCYKSSSMHKMSVATPEALEASASRMTMRQRSRQSSVRRTVSVSAKTRALFGKGKQRATMPSDSSQRAADGTEIGGPDTSDDTQTASAGGLRRQPTLSKQLSLGSFVQMAGGVLVSAAQLVEKAASSASSISDYLSEKSTREAEREEIREVDRVTQGEGHRQSLKERPGRETTQTRRARSGMAPRDGGTPRTCSDGGLETNQTVDQEPAPPMDGAWSASEWLSSLSMHETLATALLAPIAGMAPSGDAQFAYCQQLTEADLRLLLGAEGVLDRLVARALQGVQRLSIQQASTGKALSTKFASEAKFGLEYGSLEYFFRGLEGLLGPPATEVFRGMEREHTGKLDSDVPFESSNGIRTTSRDEYEFVLKPQRGKAYPERTSLRISPSRCRKPLSVEEVWTQIASRNAALREAGHNELIKEEVVAGRLYSGPMYEKYNAVLRAESRNAFLVERCETLTQGNRYATSIHAVTSCVLKLSKVTAACKVYRGIKEAALPEEFFTPNQHGVRGGVEFGFTSTSKHKHEALAYAGGDGGAPTIFEMQTGMVDRGASISCLSQYPWEDEILFAPLLGMEVLRTRVEGPMLFVQMRLTVNLTALSLEQQLSKRKRLVGQMCDALREELRHDHAQVQDWEPMATLRSDTDGWSGHEASFSTLDLQLRSAAGHDADYYNDDQALGDAIALAVRGSQRVGAWPAALSRLAAMARKDPAGLLHATQLVFNLGGCGLAEMEVTAVLLRATAHLENITLFDGHMVHGNSAGAGTSAGAASGGSVVDDALQWAEAVAALAHGLHANTTLRALNLRNFHLGKEGRLVAAALANKRHLHTIRLVHTGLGGEALALLLRGNVTLRTLDIQNNPTLAEVHGDSGSAGNENQDAPGSIGAILRSRAALEQGLSSDEATGLVERSVATDGGNPCALHHHQHGAEVAHGVSLCAAATSWPADRIGT